MLFYKDLTFNFQAYWSFKRRAANSIRGSLSLGAALALMAGVLFWPLATLAETYKVSVGEMPATLIFVEILKSIEAANPGLKFELTVAPFARSIQAVLADHTADFHYPVIRPAGGKTLPFDVSDASPFQTPFIIYENKNKLLDVKNLQRYRIETEITHIGLFPFPTIGSADISSSLHRVDTGRIDGFVYGATSADRKLIEGGFENIHRKLYAMMDVCFVLPKGGKGGPVDQALTKAIETAKSTEGFKHATAKYRAMYKGDDWQQ